jgi:NifB/MoaA-like Fe-S oxidoreductase
MIHGVKIRHLLKSSPFFKAGLRPGDVIVDINGEDISDELDFRFAAAADFLGITFARDDRQLQAEVHRDEGSFIDLEFYESPINRCTNRCIFCFIDQMPKGLRQGLYIKDEDFKHSFFNGNYVTLSGASHKDLEKVSRLGISPLYISVHATDQAVRSVMLGNKKAPPIMEQLTLTEC